MYIPTYNDPNNKKEIYRTLQILYNGVDRENKKKYKIEENRQKKITVLNEKIAFWESKLKED